MKLHTVGNLWRSKNERDAPNPAAESHSAPSADGVDRPRSLLQRVLRKCLPPRPSRPLQPSPPETPILALPLELQQKILGQLSAQDMAAMEATCAGLRAATAPLWQTRAGDLPWHVPHGPKADKRSVLQSAVLADTALAQVRRQREQGDVAAVQAHAEAMFEKIRVSEDDDDGDVPARKLGRDELTRYSLLAHTTHAFWSTRKALKLVFRVAEQTGRVSETQTWLYQYLTRSPERLQEVWATVLANHRIYVDTCLPHRPITMCGSDARHLFEEDLAHAVEATLAPDAMDRHLIIDCIAKGAWTSMKLLLDRFPDTAGVWADYFFSDAPCWDQGAQAALRDLVTRGVGARLRLEELSRLKPGIEVAEFVMTLGIGLDRPSHQGRRCLQGAVKRNAVDLVVWLLERGCDVNAPDAAGKTALHQLASSYPDESPDRQAVKKMLDLLLQHGADLHQGDGEGNTPLHLAKNRFFIAEAVARGADVNRVNQGDQCVMQTLAARHPPCLASTALIAYVARTGTRPKFFELPYRHYSQRPTNDAIAEAAWLICADEKTMCDSLWRWTSEKNWDISALVGIAYHMGCTFSYCNDRLEKLVHVLASSHRRHVDAVAFEYIKLSGESLDSMTCDRKTPLSFCVEEERARELLDLGARQFGNRDSCPQEAIDHILARPEAYKSRAQSLSEILNNLLEREL